MIQNGTSYFFCLCWLFLAGVVAPEKLHAQDPVFSQFYTSALHLNPALAGTGDQGKITLNYRNQWPSIDRAYVTYAASYDQFFRDINSGIGFSILADESGRGLLKTTVVQANYSYQVKFRNRMQMRLGLAAGWTGARVDWSKLIFGDQLDPEFGAVSPGGLPYPSDEIPPERGNNVSVLDVTTGFILYNEVFYAGLTLKHLNSPEFSFLRVNNDLYPGLPLSFSLHGGAEIHVNQRGPLAGVFTSPSFQYIRQGGVSQLIIGTIFRYYKLGTGAWYRHANVNPDALILLLEGRQGPYRIAYTYDLTLSGLNRTGGAHEISVMIDLGGEQKESRYNDCFNMFR